MMSTSFPLRSREGERKKFRRLRVSFRPLPLRMLRPPFKSSHCARKTFWLPGDFFCLDCFLLGLQGGILWLFLIIDKLFLSRGGSGGGGRHDGSDELSNKKGAPESTAAKLSVRAVRNAPPLSFPVL